MNANPIQMLYDFQYEVSQIITPPEEILDEAMSIVDKNGGYICGIVDKLIKEEREKLKKISKAYGGHLTCYLEQIPEWEAFLQNHKYAKRERASENWKSMSSRLLTQQMKQRERSRAKEEMLQLVTRLDMIGSLFLTTSILVASVWVFQRYTHTRPYLSFIKFNPF
jgi:hypothetical protein